MQPSWFVINILTEIQYFTHVSYVPVAFWMNTTCMYLYETDAFVCKLWHKFISIFIHDNLPQQKI